MLKIKTQRTPKTRAGEAAMSNVFMLALSAFVIVLLLTFGRNLWSSVRTAASDPQDLLQNPTIVVFAVGAVVGGLAWSIRQLITSLTLRTQMAILHTLSDKRPRTLEEIVDEIKTHHRDKQSYSNFRLVRGSITDSLASLVANGSVEIEDGKYVRPGRKTNAT